MSPLPGSVDPAQDRTRSAAPSGARRFEHRESSTAPLPFAFYARPAEVVARDLLGRTVVSVVDGMRCAGEIVETEAYVGPDDEASHAHRRFGRTRRNGVMFEAPGAAYLYRSYGIHWCLNAVTDRVGFPAAVLIRAARPLTNIETMRRRRVGRSDRELMRGPGNLCQALGLDGTLNGHQLDSPPLWIERGRSVEEVEVVAGPRIGITRAAERPLRFHLRGSAWVSRRAGDPDLQRRSLVERSG